MLDGIRGWLPGLRRLWSGLQIDPVIPYTRNGLP